MVDIAAIVDFVVSGLAAMGLPQLGMLQVASTYHLQHNANLAANYLNLEVRTNSLAAI